MDITFLSSAVANISKNWIFNIFWNMWQTNLHKLHEDHIWTENILRYLGIWELFITGVFVAYPQEN